MPLTDTGAKRPSKQDELKLYLALEWPRLWAAIYDTPPQIMYPTIAAFFMISMPPTQGVLIETIAEFLLRGAKMRKAGLEPAAKKLDS